MGEEDGKTVSKKHVGIATALGIVFGTIFGRAIFGNVGIGAALGRASR